jgi:uncharacterized protein (DUF433 family)
MKDFHRTKPNFNGDIDTSHFRAVLTVKKYFYEDRKPAFSLTEEPAHFRLKIEQSEIEEHHVEEFLDKTVEWLSANSEKPLLIDFEGVKWVCSDFTAHLAEYCRDAKAKGFIVELVNVGPAIQPYVDGGTIVTVPFTPRRSVLSISTKQVLEDIEGNLSNQDLMDKYGLSLRGLASLFKKLLNKGLITRRYLEERTAQQEGPIEIDLDGDDFLKTVVPALDVLKDIADDMSNEMLMKKYGLSEKGLNSMWEKLSVGNLISEETLRKRSEPKKS